MSSSVIYLHATPAAVGRARQQIDRLNDRLSADVLQDARLMVSELVTNSLRHGAVGSGQQIELSIAIVAGILRVEVCDPGPGFTPEPRSAASPDGMGWGLVLVDRLADSWGVRHDGVNRVWFELADGLTGPNAR
jgi:anti-sigma regulatory factor (Ser/Thr protein kinase)